MGEQIKSITKETLIPLGLAITIVMALLGGTFWAGKLSERVARTEASISECKAWQSAAPTQYQFESLKDAIDELKADTKAEFVELKKSIDNLE